MKRKLVGGDNPSKRMKTDDGLVNLDKEYKCLKCSSSFNQKENLDWHLKAHNAKKVRIFYKCSSSNAFSVNFH